MMKYFRKHTKIIIWMVVVSFAVFGGYSMTSMKKEDRFAGQVFGKNVSFQEFKKFHDATILFMPIEDKETGLDPTILRAYTWQNIIFAHEAKNRGIKVTDDEVQIEIGKILKQQGLTNPDAQDYQNWLMRGLRIPPHQFEEGLREFIRIQKLINSELKGITSVPESSGTEELDEKAKEEAQKETQNAFMLWSSMLIQQANIQDFQAAPMPTPEELMEDIKQTVESMQEEPSEEATPEESDPENSAPLQPPETTP